MRTERERARSAIGALCCCAGGVVRTVLVAAPVATAAFGLDRPIVLAAVLVITALAAIAVQRIAAASGASRRGASEELGRCAVVGAEPIRSVRLTLAADPAARHSAVSYMDGPGEVVIRVSRGFLSWFEAGAYRESVVRFVVAHEIAHHRDRYERILRYEFAAADGSRSIRQRMIGSSVGRLIHALLAAPFGPGKLFAEAIGKKPGCGSIVMLLLVCVIAPAYFAARVLFRALLAMIALSAPLAIGRERRRDTLRDAEFAHDEWAATKTFVSEPIDAHTLSMLRRALGGDDRGARDRATHPDVDERLDAIVTAVKGAKGSIAIEIAELASCLRRHAPLPVRAGKAKDPLAALVAQKIAALPELTDHTFRFDSIGEGIVTITGEVESFDAAEACVAAVKRVEGVADAINAMTVRAPLALRDVLVSRPADARECRAFPNGPPCFDCGKPGHPAWRLRWTRKGPFVCERDLATAARVELVYEAFTDALALLVASALAALGLHLSTLLRLGGSLVLDGEGERAYDLLQPLTLDMIGILVLAGACAFVTYGAQHAPFMRPIDGGRVPRWMAPWMPLVMFAATAGAALAFVHAARLEEREPWAPLAAPLTEWRPMDRSAPRALEGETLETVAWGGLRLRIPVEDGLHLDRVSMSEREIAFALMGHCVRRVERLRWDAPVLAPLPPLLSERDTPVLARLAPLLCLRPRSPTVVRVTRTSDRRGAHSACWETRGDWHGYRCERSVSAWHDTYVVDVFVPIARSAPLGRWLLSDRQREAFEGEARRVAEREARRVDHAIAASSEVRVYVRADAAPGVVWAARRATPFAALLFVALLASGLGTIRRIGDD